MLTLIHLFMVSKLDGHRANYFKLNKRLSHLNNNKFGAEE